MLVARYFLYVGGALIALLIGIGYFVPTGPAAAIQTASSVDKSTVRIRSDQKLPERVVYDTNLPTIVPPAPASQVAATSPAPASVPASGQTRVNDSFAEFVPTEPKKAEPQAPKKRKVAKVHAPTQLYPTYYAPQPPMRVAQQSRFGFWSW